MKPEVPFGYDYCRDCKETKEIHLFPTAGSYCRKCLTSRQKANPNYKENAYRNRLKKFGLTPEQYEQMNKDQNGLCAICHKPETTAKKERLAVDHDHETNAVRGLLCNKCNVGIGQFDDNMERLENAVDYLKKYL
jgi:hypothetical protein